MRLLELAGRDQQLRAAIPDPTVEAALSRPGLSYRQAITTVLEGYSERPALGAREYELMRDTASGRVERGYLPRFQTLSYAGLHDRIKCLVSAWRHHPQIRVEPGEFVCTLGFGGVGYVTADLACALRRAVSVPLHNGMGLSDLDAIFADTAPTCVVAPVSDLELAATLAGSHSTIRSILVFEYDERVDRDRELYEAALTILTRNGSAAQLATIGELISFGSALPWEGIATDEDDDQRLAMLLHSSGSTGTPKGVMIPAWHARSAFTRESPRVPVIHLAFCPMSHAMGRGAVYGALARGGTACFTAKPDMSTLFEDLRLVRPTDAAFFPRVLETVHRQFLSEVARRTEAGQDNAQVSAEVMAEMRAGLFGDRLVLMSAGSAPTPPEVRQFIRECFDLDFLDTYGSTEASTVLVNGEINRTFVTDYRLRDVSDLGYFSTDKPYPRGELLVKTALAVPGYFQRPEATAALFDDGYIVTGDIMEERAPGHLAYVDRRNDVLKLAQGEFVTTGALAVTFEDDSDLIEQIYVYGNSTRSFLVAVVVPDLDVARSVLGGEPSGEALRGLIRSELTKVGKSAALKAFEIPRDILVETEPFSFENGLLTAMGKRRRPALRQSYGERLEQLFSDLERRQHEELIALRNPNGGLSVLHKIGKALEASLGIQDVDLDRPHSFTELGGDSLGAISFSVLLKEIFGVAVPVNTILSPAGNPKHWAQVIESALDEDDGVPTFERIHGKGARRLDVKDLDLTGFLGARAARNASTIAPPSVAPIVLLTGANGFLGRFLCLEWLERVAPMGGEVVCLIRATNHDGAVVRLDAAFEGDPELEKRYRALAENHLEVVVGDVAESRLGLPPEVFDRLAHTVDRIVHPAALVNHLLDYEYLFGPNVAGTAELIGLALTGKRKAIDFISSRAVAPFTDRGHGDTEDAPLLDVVELSGRYGSGYGASKWAAEQLLRHANREFGLPVNVFRGDMMLAHSQYAKQLNVQDIFARLLYSIVITELAPRSFYRLDPSRPKAHYDGLPVDFVAATIVGISVASHSDVRTFNVRNHNITDGISLDTFVDWIEAAGYAIERIGNYAEWLQRFETKLRALPEEKRNQSSLSVLDPLREPLDSDDENVSSTRFDAALRSLVGTTAPRLTEEFIGKCLRDLQSLELIPPPR